MAGEERQDAGTFAYTLVEHVADQGGDNAAQAYLIEVVDEVMLLEPGVREHFSDLLLGELVEELTRRGHKDAAGRVLEVQAAWEQET